MCDGGPAPSFVKIGFPVQAPIALVDDIVRSMTRSRVTKARAAAANLLSSSRYPLPPFLPLT